MLEIMTKPIDADFYGWRDFLEWAENNGISDIDGDWDPWWECWRAAYSAAMNS